MKKLNKQITVERSIYSIEGMMISTELKKQVMRRKIERMMLEGQLKAQKYEQQNSKVNIKQMACKLLKTFIQASKSSVFEGMGKKESESLLMKNSNMGSIYLVSEEGLTD